MRGGWDLPASAEDPLDADFPGAPWFMDSLELVTLSGMIAESFQVHRSGIEDMLLARRSVHDWAEIIHTSLQHYDQEMVFYTSGSTGVPKPVMHQTALLQQEIAAIAAELPSGIRRIVSTVPAHHIYGFLFTILLPQHLMLETVPAAGVRPVLEDTDLVIAVPAVLRSWRARGASLPAGVTVVSSTAPLGDEDAAWVLQTGAKLVEVFGSSETAGIGVRRNREEGFRLFPYWERSKDGDQLWREGLPGQVPLLDSFEWLNERSFIYRGRKDHAVQIHGINVFPNQVEEKLGSHPLVQAAAVRSFESPAGTRLKAFIVPADNTATAEIEQQLRNWAAQNLPIPERPAHYRFGSTLPRTELGKAADFS
ncbi:acyl-CoA synthetase/AMP-acid ligase [Spirochaeta africana DSM 8902]|uniref:Acyl-CoA synthetase/AMP-acid ligase n=2 Tax=Spirochaeta TaxID=146 RepID=H9UJX5_SPIAZ|nr:acyl-CoA synthetase/AMP-acid ligase [Spirochaeta africana DSM 8902]